MSTQMKEAKGQLIFHQTNARKGRHISITPENSAMLIASTVGLILQYSGSYLPIFVIAGSAYLVALGIIHLLAPRLEPASVEEAIA